MEVILAIIYVVSGGALGGILTKVFDFIINKRKASAEASAKEAETELEMEARQQQLAHEDQDFFTSHYQKIINSLGKKLDKVEEEMQKLQADHTECRILAQSQASQIRELEKYNTSLEKRITDLEKLLGAKQ